MDVSGYDADVDKAFEIAQRLTDDLKDYDDVDYSLSKELMNIYQNKHFTLHDSADCSAVKS